MSIQMVWMLSLIHILMKHDYEKKLKNPIHDKTVAIRDTYRRQQEHKSSQASIVQYTVGEQVQHPKFGEGCIEKIEQDVYKRQGIMSGLVFRKLSVKKVKVLFAAVLITVPGTIVSSVINAVLFGGVTSSGSSRCV